MTSKAISRLEIFIKVAQRSMTQAAAAVNLGLSVRQTQRLYAAFQQQGTKALASSQKGKASNHQLALATKQQLISAIHNPIYAGFGPTFMCEKLIEYHAISVSIETVRQLMIKHGLWEEKRKKKGPVVHQQRPRRSRYGELVQIDGSPHPWFEDRGTSSVLIVYIDDATGHAHGKFFTSETTEAYLVTTREYIKKYGRPIAFYSDRYSVFKINKPGCVRHENLTQFGRALKELDIHNIWANSPQAKGRVERANGILQDRLVKELRLAGISTIEAANVFLEHFWEQFNQKFNVKPQSDENAHRVLLQEQNLDRILCIKEYRKVSKNLEIQYENIIYQIESRDNSKQLYGAQVTVLARCDGSIIDLEYKGRSLPFKKYIEQVNNGKVVSSKEIDRFLRDKIPHKVPVAHPWRSSAA